MDNQTEATRNEQLSQSKRQLKLVLYRVPNSPQCDQMATVLKFLQEEHPQEFAISEGDAAEVGIEKVPLVCVISDNGEETARVSGANPPALVKLVKDIIAEPSNFSDISRNIVDYSRLMEIVEREPVMLIAKGNKEEGFFCGFSKRAAALLRKYNIEYGAFDVFTDDVVREGLKVYSNWPTYPQLYVKGEFIGGIDILEELDRSGNLEAMLKHK